MLYEVITRRLIVPLSYFIERPFQNWTRESAELIGTVMLYLDHTADIDAIRDRGREIAQESELWDGNVYAVHVTRITSYNVCYTKLLRATTGCSTRCPRAR